MVSLPPLQYSITPVLRFSPNLDVPSVDAFARERAIVNILGQTEQQLMPPEKVRRRVLGNETHALAKNFFSFFRIESLPFRRQQLVEFRIRITDPWRPAG